jgi:uncharacterized protein DUF6916
MSTSSRRKFLTTAGTLIAAAAAAPLAAVRPPRLEDAPAGSGRTATTTAGQAGAWINKQPLYQSVALFQFTPELFQPLVGTQFKVADSHGQRASLRLMAVSDLKKQNLSSKTAFSLQFQLVGGKALPQGTYQFFTPTLGTFLMFVVPSAAAKNPHYTAIINRI